jgi:hypothetical protein
VVDAWSTWPSISNSACCRPCPSVIGSVPCRGACALSVATTESSAPRW